MKKLFKLTFLTSILATSPLAFVVACSNSNSESSDKNKVDQNNEQTTQPKPKISFNFDELSSLEVSKQREKIINFIEKVISKEVDKYQLDNKEYEIKFDSEEETNKSLSVANEYIEKYFPSISYGDDTIVDTGQISFSDLSFPIPTKEGEQFKVDNFPQAPKNTHWEFSCDDLFMENGSTKYWTKFLGAFKLPFGSDKKPNYTFEAKLAADFGFTLKSEYVIKVVFK